MKEKKILSNSFPPLKKKFGCVLIGVGSTKTRRVKVDKNIKLTPLNNSDFFLLMCFLNVNRHTNERTLIPPNKTESNYKYFATNSIVKLIVSSQAVMKIYITNRIGREKRLAC